MGKESQLVCCREIRVQQLNSGDEVLKGSHIVSVGHYFDHEIEGVFKCCRVEINFLFVGCECKQDVAVEPEEIVLVDVFLEEEEIVRFFNLLVEMEKNEQYFSAVFRDVFAEVILSEHEVE
jgi:hypothetical protein